MRSHMSQVHFKLGISLALVTEITSTDVWTTFLSGPVQCIECCDPLVTDCSDSLLLASEGA